MRSRTLPLLAALAVAAGTTLPAAHAAPADAGGAHVRPAFVFVSDRDGDNELFVRRTDGSVRQLTRNRVDDFGPSWSPDGRRLVFSRTVGGGTALFVVRADGSGVRRLTTPVTRPEGPGSYDVAPAWSPDGRQVAFASDRAGDEADIWRVDADGTDLVRLTSGEPFHSEFNPTWSPDGRWIWFDTDRWGYFNRELVRIRPDGTRARRMTTTAEDVDDGAPEFSPDGRRVVFTSTRANGSQDLFTMRPDGSGVRPLGRPTAGQDEVFPRWAPDGRTVLFWRFGTAADPTERIWAIDADGTDRRRIPTGPGDAGSPDPYPVPAR